MIETGLADTLTEGMKKVEERFGFHYTECKDGHAVSVLDVEERHLNFMNIVYGGIMFNMADLTCGAAFLSAGGCGATIDANMQYLSSSAGTKQITCDCHVTKLGKRIGFTECRITNEDGVLMATGSYTYANSPMNETIR